MQPTIFQVSFILSVTFGGAAFLLACSFMDCSTADLAVAFLALSSLMLSASAAGVLTSSVCIAPVFTGIVTSMTRIAALFAAVVAPLMVSFLTRNVCHKTKEILASLLELIVFNLANRR